MLKKAFRILILFSIFILILIFVANIPILEVKNKVSDAMLELKNDSNVCILKNAYTTGTKWQVVYDQNDRLLNENVVLCCDFDPRLLKENKDFDLDYMAQYVVSVDKIDKITVNDELINVIYPKKIIIVYDTSKSYYTVADFSVQGLFKSLMGIINKKYKLCY